MTDGSVIVAVVGVGVGLLAVLVPVLLALAAGIRRELDHVRADVAEVRAEVRADVAEVRRDVHALSDRVARIEGALTGPWRPPNGGPAPPASAETASEPAAPVPAR